MWREKSHFIIARSGKAKGDGAWMGLQRGAIFGVVWSQVESQGTDDRRTGDCFVDGGD